MDACKNVDYVLHQAAWAMYLEVSLCLYSIAKTIILGTLNMLEASR